MDDLGEPHFRDADVLCEGGLFDQLMMGNGQFLR